MFWSVSYGHLPCCKLLKQYGSDHDHVDEMQQTPMFYAVKSNRVDVATWLLSQGIRLDIQDKKGMSLINFAQKYNRQQMKELLAGHGAPVP
jgi:ankyrin repeat protein